MGISMNYGRTGQSRSTQDPQKLIEASQGKYHDAACDLSEEQRYPKVGKSNDPRPFVVRGSAG